MNVDNLVFAILALTFTLLLNNSAEGVRDRRRRTGEPTKAAALAVVLADFILIWVCMGLAVFL